MIRSLPSIIGGAVVALLLVVMLLQLAGLRGDVADARAEASTAAAAADSAASALEEVRTAMEALNDELAALPRSGVVPTDSSGVILERLTQIRDDLAALSTRVDDICRNAPVSLC